MITEVEDFIRSVVKIIDMIDVDRFPSNPGENCVRGKHRSEMAGITLYTAFQQQKDKTFRVSLGGDGWLLILAARKKLQRNPPETIVQMRHKFTSVGEMWITNYTILSPEKFEDDLTILKLLI